MKSTFASSSISKHSKPERHFVKASQFAFRSMVFPEATTFSIFLVVMVCIASAAADSFSSLSGGASPSGRTAAVWTSIQNDLTHGSSSSQSAGAGP